MLPYVLVLGNVAVRLELRRFGRQTTFLLFCFCVQATRETKLRYTNDLISPSLDIVFPTLSKFELHCFLASIASSMCRSLPGMLLPCAFNRHDAPKLRFVAGSISTGTMLFVFKCTAATANIVFTRV